MVVRTIRQGRWVGGVVHQQTSPAPDKSWDGNWFWRPGLGGSEWLLVLVIVGAAPSLIQHYKINTELTTL